MKSKKILFLILGLIALALICIAPVMAQDAATTTPDAPAAVSPDAGSAIAAALTPVIQGLSGRYGWLTTVIMVVGTLRILFKPVMMAVENTVAKDPDKLAKLQAFEAGPIFKGISFVLDFGGSIKLPAIKANIK